MILKLLQLGKKFLSPTTLTDPDHVSESDSDSDYSDWGQQVLLQQPQGRRRSILASLTTHTNLPQLNPDTLKPAKYWFPLTSYTHTEFWEACDPWLCQRGYHLYNCLFEGFGLCRIPDIVSPPDPHFPYAQYTYVPKLPLCSWSSQLTVQYARDSQERELIIKAAVTGSQQHKIYKALQQRAELYDPNQFPSVLPPLDVLETDCGYCFIVQPRWGLSVHYSGLPRWFDDISQCFVFIKSMLRALSFLHAHRIVHRDISDANIVANVFCYNDKFDVNCLALIRRGLLSSPARYALIDFDVSVMFPSDIPIEECRLTTFIGGLGAPWYAPPDIYQGDLVYDPFAYDVGCMGNLLVTHFVHLIHQVPLLAPLLDRMTSRVISRRFTASEALSFFEMVEANTSTDVLASSVKANRNHFDDELSWAGLDAQFVNDWGLHRTPPITMWERFVLWMRDSDRFGWYALRFVRFFRLWFQYGGRYPSYYKTDYELW